MSPTAYPILDVTFDEFVEPLTPGWDVWRVEALLESGDTVVGTIIGDGVSGFGAESFEPETD